MILINTKLSNNLKKIIGNNVEDVLLFGSTVKGKDKPNDTDILIIFKNKVDKEVEFLIKKELEKYYKNVSIVSKTIKTVFEESFDARESLLFEAVSLINKKFVNDKYGFVSLGMFLYSLNGWSNLQKTKFYHALNGRNSLGMLKELKCIKLSDNVILSPLNKIEPLIEFFDSWKIKYKYVPILVPKRLESYLERL